MGDPYELRHKDLKLILDSAIVVAQCNPKPINSYVFTFFMAENYMIRKLTPRECFRLQTMPEDLIDKALTCGVSNTQLYKIAGNGWTDEVIAHIFRGLLT